MSHAFTLNNQSTTTTMKDPQADQAVEQLAYRFLGERIPIEVKTTSGQVLIPHNRAITKAMLHKCYQNRAVLDIAPSPIRRIMLEILAPFGGES